MPIKHQAESYRTIGGKRWQSWGDFPEEESVTEKGRLINKGVRVRLWKMDDGMVRIFTDRSPE